MPTPETRYAKSGDVNIAYQVSGDGPFDLVFAPGYVTHLELHWKMPSFAPFLHELSSFCRLIRFDKRRTGMSDPVSGAPTLETRMDDVRAVMDAVGSKRAAFYGLSEGAAMSILFAATYPERTAALVVRSAFPRRMWAPDYPWGRTEEDYQREVERDLRMFGPRDVARESVRALGRFEDEEVEAFMEMVRFGSSPGALEALHRMNKEIDIRHVLPAVTFTTEVWESGGWEESEPDRALATILFTDIVGSTAQAAELGDRGWRELLEAHHALIRQQLVRFRGRELDTAGDGFFASFDGPARGIRCASSIAEEVRRLGIEIRAGLHTGECELLEGKVAGIAVSIGARVAGRAGPGEVLVSQTVKDLVAGSGIEFDERGAAELKGVPGEWRLYAVADS